MPNARQETSKLQDRLIRAGLNVDFADAELLRRAQMTLSRWAELECGDGNDFTSWALERDAKTDKPYMVFYPHDGKSYRRPVPDRENGALKRVAVLCKKLGAHFYHQTDPRGCTLYVSREPLTDSDYNRGVSC